MVGREILKMGYLAGFSFFSPGSAGGGEQLTRGDPVPTQLSSHRHAAPLATSRAKKNIKISSEVVH